MVLSDKQKEYKKNYMKIWRAKNKEKNKQLNKKYRQKYNNNNKEKLRERNKNYSKLKYCCLFCQNEMLLRDKKRHRKTNIHKKNILKFNRLLVNHINNHKIF